MVRTRAQAAREEANENATRTRMDVNGLPDEIVQRFLLEATAVYPLDGTPAVALRDFATGKAINLVCRRFRRLIESDWASTWTVLSDERLATTVGMLEEDPTRATKVTDVLLVLTETFRGIEAGDRDAFFNRRLPRAFDNRHWTSLTTLTLSLIKDAPAGHEIDSSVATWLTLLGRQPLPSLRTLSVEFGADPGADPFGHLPTVALFVILAATVNLKTLKLKYVVFFQPTTLPIMPIPPPVKLEQLQLVGVELTDDTASYLASCVTEAKELVTQLVESQSPGAVQQLLTGAQASTQLQTAAFLNLNGEGEIDVPAFLEARTDFRVLSGSFAEVQFSFAHRLHATLLRPRKDLRRLNLNTLATYLAAGNAPSLKELFLDLERADVVTDGGLSEDLKALFEVVRQLPSKPAVTFSLRIDPTGNDLEQLEAAAANEGVDE